MDKNKITRKGIELLSKAIIHAMPKSYFTAENEAKKYMLSGDDKFTSVPGDNCFWCGFGKRVLTPDDINAEKYYIAGYDSNNPATGVLDDMYARAVYLADGTGRDGVIMCAIDAVGISRKDINEIRRLVLENEDYPTLRSELRSINICATHSHSAIDTQGLWGEKLYKSGRNEKFMKRLHQKAAEAIIEAYETSVTGKLYYAVNETEDLQFDCRTPNTFDSNLTRIRFEAENSDHQIYIVNFASHAELLGDKTKNVSADFPAYMIKEIEDLKYNTDAVFFNGAIGGMISAKEIKKVYRNEIDCEAYTKEFGKNLGKLVTSMEDEKPLKPIINIKSKQVKIAADNFVLILARVLKVLNNDIARSSKRDTAYIWSEVGYLELGDGEIGMFLIPGELFPELYNGEFLTADESANAVDAHYRVLKDLGGAKHNFVVGLCNDELGYIIPDNDFILNEGMPYINSAKDRFDRNHYEETNSTGRNTARTLLEEMDKLIASTK